MSKIYVLGCGPAGLAAAHAATTLGYDVEIFSKKRKSHMFGAQYLHKPIPGLKPGDRQEINYILQGSIQEYRSKVYGTAFDVTVSPDSLEQNHSAWDIRYAYDQLWDKYRRHVRPADINPGWMIENSRLRPMISSVPLPIVCSYNLAHSFERASIWAAGEAPELGVFIQDAAGIPDGTVVCNGRKEPSWYRASRIFGRATIEWPYIADHAYGASVDKPISTTCDCWPYVLRVGRYGKWQKGILVHQAYEEAHEWLRSL